MDAIPEIENYNGERLRRSLSNLRSSCQQAAKMLAILSVLFLLFCCPVFCIFQRLYCTISDSCDCDFKPNIKGKTIHVAAFSRGNGRVLVTVSFLARLKRQLGLSANKINIPSSYSYIFIHKYVYFLCLVTTNSYMKVHCKHFHVVCFVS